MVSTEDGNSFSHHWLLLRHSLCLLLFFCLLYPVWTWSNSIPRNNIVPGDRDGDRPRAWEKLDGRSERPTGWKHSSQGEEMRGGSHQLHCLWVGPQALAAKPTGKRMCSGPWHLIQCYTASWKRQQELGPVLHCIKTMSANSYCCWQYCLSPFKKKKKKNFILLSGSRNLYFYLILFLFCFSSYFLLVWFQNLFYWCLFNYVFLFATLAMNFWICIHKLYNRLMNVFHFLGIFSNTIFCKL